MNTTTTTTKRMINIYIGDNIPHSIIDKAVESATTWLLNGFRRTGEVVTFQWPEPFGECEAAMVAEYIAEQAHLKETPEWEIFETKRISAKSKWTKHHRETVEAEWRILCELAEDMIKHGLNKDSHDYLIKELKGYINLYGDK